MALRVAIVVPWGERLGGAEEGLWQALKHLDRDRIEPSVAFLGPGGFEEEVSELEIATEVIPTGRLRQPISTAKTIRRLAAWLRRSQPDLLLNWSAKAHLYGFSAARLARFDCRVVWWQHMIPHGAWIDRLATILPADAIGCWSSPSRNAQERLRPGRSTFIVNPGVETHDRLAARDPRLRHRLGIPDGQTVVGIVGRLQPWKGQDRLLRAVADLRARGRDVHALVVGGDAYGLSPQYAAELEELIPVLGLDGRVTLTGQVPDASPYMGEMDVSVNASDEEPFGIVLIEAMAAGVPVVAVGNGGPLDIVDPGVTGELAESGAPGELAAAIDKVVADPERCREMGAAGRERCRERFTAQLMADRLAERLVEIADA